MMNELTKLLDALLNAPAPLICVLALIAFNLLLRRIPHVPNWTIPVLSAALGMVFFSFIPRTPELTTFKLLLIGFIAGIAAGCFYGAIIIFAESKWPWLATFINGPGPGAPASPSPSPAETKSNPPSNEPET